MCTEAQNKLPGDEGHLRRVNIFSRFSEALRGNFNDNGMDKIT